MAPLLKKYLLRTILEYGFKATNHVGVKRMSEFHKVSLNLYCIFFLVSFLGIIFYQFYDKFGQKLFEFRIATLSGLVYIIKIFSFSGFTGFFRAFRIFPGFTRIFRVLIHLCIKKCNLNNIN